MLHLVHEYSYVHLSSGTVMYAYLISFGNFHREITKITIMGFTENILYYVLIITLLHFHYYCYESPAV